jgi:hypothetical protein
MAANSVSSDPAANFTASQGFEPFVPLATAAGRRRCLVTVAICISSTQYTLALPSTLPPEDRENGASPG